MRAYDLAYYRRPVAEINWGILSTGSIASRFAADVARTDGAAVVAVGSRTPEAAQLFAAEHGIARAHGSWAALAADPEVDVVYVATPHSAHHAAAALCLRAGKAVLCEKPFALNASQARDLIALAGERGLFLMEGMWMHANPAVQAVVRLVEQGAIGAITRVAADFGLAGPIPTSHRLRDPRLGGGALLDLGVYPVALAHRLLGVPKSVTASAQLTPEGVDAQTRLELQYEEGAVATLECGIDAETPWTATVTGTGGQIVLPRPFFASDRYRLDGSEVVLPHRGFIHEIEEVGRCIRAGLVQSPLAGWAQTVEVMEILDEARDQIGVRYSGE
jgi:predicted dehydrogenase